MHLDQDAVEQAPAAPASETVPSDATSSDATHRDVTPSALGAPGGRLVPESAGYRLKNLLLGPPIATERQSKERLGKPTALAVLSSDVISSSAYATEQILLQLVKVIGVAAFSLVVPITVAVVGVLVFVTLSYLEVVKVYTKAGGAYVVARENFGLGVAQIAAVALLIDYVLTVAVSVAAGAAALTSVFPNLASDTVWFAIGAVVIIAYGNLRGVREAGRMFAVPTYFFIVNMAILIVVGSIKAIAGDLHAHPLVHPGIVPLGTPGKGLLLGASLFVVLKAFASGGSALTGTEAISNGVSVFRKPESRNARITLVLMSLILGSLVLGIAALASIVHPIPYVNGTPTVVSQVAKYVYGSGVLPHILFVALQIGTMFILVLAANTSFTGFPYLASFAATDSYLPRQLTRRGHRLVFSAGILALTAIAIVLLIVTNARVDNLIPLYAIGVFTGFTMAGAGMTKYHLTKREPNWRRRAAINGTAAVLSFIVDVIFAVTKFTEGAWAVVVLMPLGVVALMYLHRQYAAEDVQLEEGSIAACEAPILHRHVVFVFVNQVDLATARAVQYARTLSPDELRAVHFAIDPAVAQKLEREWGRLALSRLPLDVIEVPDRRLTRAALEFAAEAGADGNTEVSVLLPRRGFPTRIARLLHDRSADEIAEALSSLPHVNATIVPFQLQRRHGRPPSRIQVRDEQESTQVIAPSAKEFAQRTVGTVPIGEIRWRQRVRVAGRIHSMRVPTAGASAVLECTLVDGTGAVLLVFQGRRRIPGIQQGSQLIARGVVGAWDGNLAILNPDYELISGEGTE